MPVKPVPNKRTSKSLNCHIRTFETEQFISEYMRPAQELQQMLKNDYGKFFIVPVEEMIKVSKLPVPPTRATTHTLIYLTSGIATMNVGFKKTEIRRNQCIVVPAGQVFSYEKHEKNEGFILNFNDRFLIGRASPDLLREFDFLNLWGDTVITLHESVGALVGRNLQRVLNEYKCNGITNSRLIISYVTAMLYELKAASAGSLKTKSTTHLDITFRFREALKNHLTQKHTVSDYASLLNVSPNHLNKVLKEATGKNASRWIAESLVAEAKVLLAQTPDAVKTIAWKLGMEDHSYFSRLFKKIEKMTPIEFKRSIDLS
jgi:AraC family transcriptional regulator, transcriptional activator of pobA